MLKTPLKLVTRSYKTPVVMWFLMLFVYKIELLYIFPRKSVFSSAKFFFLVLTLVFCFIVMYDQLGLIYF